MVLNPTPRERLCDPQGRPYFLWDVDTTLDEFRHAMATATPAVRASLLGKLMRQARPDDVFTFVSADEIAASWHDVERYLGRARPFWHWLLRRWRLLPDDRPA